MQIAYDIDLAASIDDYRKIGEHIYLLIEGAGSNPVARERLFVNDEGLIYIPIYAGTEYEPILETSPILVPIEKIGNFFNWFINEGLGYRSGIIIVARCGPKKVLNHLQGMIEVKLPDHNFAAFRYQDPVVLDRYLTAADSKDMECILGPLTAFIWPVREWVQRAGQRAVQEWQWRELHRNQPLEKDNGYLKPQLPIEISQVQIDAMEQHYYEQVAADLLYRMPAR